MLLFSLFAGKAKRFSDAIKVNVCIKYCSPQGMSGLYHYAIPASKYTIGSNIRWCCRTLYVGIGLQVPAIYNRMTQRRLYTTILIAQPIYDSVM